LAQAIRLKGSGGILSVAAFVAFASFCGAASQLDT